MAATQEHGQIAIGTPLGENALLLRSFSVSESIGRLFHIQAELLSEDPEHQLDFDKLVGHNVTIRLALASGDNRFFNGHVASLKMVAPLGRFSRYQAVIVPRLWFLTRASNCRIFQEKKVPDIVKEVLKDRGIDQIEDNLAGSYRTWEYCVQYRETDFNFVSRLMEQEGIYYYFKHENGKHTMVLVDQAGSHKPFPAYEEIEFRSEAEGASQEENISDWILRQELQPVDYALRDFDFIKPGTDLTTRSGVSRKHAAAEFEMYDYPGEYKELADGENYAKIRIEEIQAQFEVVQGVADARGLSAGFTFTLASHPRADQNRKYLATSVQYTVESEEFDTTAGGSGGFHCRAQFTAIDASQQFRAPRATPKPLIQGPQTAIVVGPKGEEIYTDKHARVKVKFHWDRYSKADQDSSCWIRVAQVWAGKKWGAMYIPRIGQEVIVEFLEGDPDQPIVTGRVYNGETTPPYDLPDEKTKSTIKSNSSKGGSGFNEFRFEDKKGSEQVFIHAEKDMEIRVKNNRREKILANRHLVVSKDKLERIFGERHERIGKSHFEKIRKDRNVEVDGEETKVIKGKKSLTVQGNVAEEFLANHSENVASDYYLKAVNIVIEADTNITLKVGSSHIAIEAGGIKIGTSGQIKLDAKGPLSAQSAAKADIKSPMTSVKGDATVIIKGGIVKIN